MEFFIIKKDAMNNENINGQEPIDNVEQLLNEHETRVNKVKEISKLGLESWPYRETVDSTCAQVKAEFVPETEKGCENKPAKEAEKEYSLAGRVITIRLHGKTGFCTIQDRSGRLQIYVKQDIVGDKEFDFFKDYIDIGDIVWVSGKSFLTKTGEITLKVEKFKLLSKCLYPLPEKFHGIADIEIKYRQRYLDLISSPETVEKFKKRSKIVRTMRNFLDSNDFVEVETPMLHPILGGAAAKPFVTHHNALDSDFYLRIAPELYLKRLVIGGLERVYEINRNFRNEGVSTKHNPEFTMLEYYTAHEDYIFAMAFLQELMKKVVSETCDSMIVKFGEHEIDFSKPFEILSMQDSILKYGDLKKEDLLPENIDKTIKLKGAKLDNINCTLGYKLAALFDAVAEKNLIQPTFITEYPIDISPLSKTCPNNPEVTSRFELFISGMEIANGYNELNDPFDQAERFKKQVEAKESGDAEAHEYDHDFILALEHALPPTVGVGVGIDRFVMLLTDTTSIKDVILFPTLKKR
ncbi:MAG: Lysine-tRNA ligase [candidate division TM6 bacterium GW2011_GWF2_30_66]|nr:MAG: Lysine-tRNA ligase [candidate division TM6 bacterium GW2011_GWF2_30_66]